MLGPLDPWSYLATVPAAIVAVVAGLGGVPRLAVILGLLALLIALVDSFSNRGTAEPPPDRATVTRPRSNHPAGLRAHGGPSRG
ncbi:hypothetical protein ACOBQX_03100 [Actinokineospora sp. G85]|uniref:hypothetical protein n=1 Tax=Actinokineospora sp. G85 TaxID=3406626 RepID=UPI003C77D489